jgi:AcrR family transcriptional regulator
MPSAGAAREILRGAAGATTVQAATPRRTQAQRREESDHRLMAAAARIIAEEGYPAATLERVGEAAGFSRGLASRKYGSKDGLIEAVIRHVAVYVNARVDAALEGVDDPARQVLALVDRFVALVQEDLVVRAYFVLFSAMIANRLETRAVFAEVQQQFGARIEAPIRAAQQAGTIAAQPPATMLAYLVGSLLAGIAVEMTMDHASQFAPEELRAGLALPLRRALGIAG